MRKAADGAYYTAAKISFVGFTVALRHNKPIGLAAAV
jgi:hypothetical protein